MRVGLPRRWRRMATRFGLQRRESLREANIRCRRSIFCRLRILLSEVRAGCLQNRTAAYWNRRLAWADVVHFMMPFALSRVGLRIAKEMGKPVTAAFHVQPENITSTIHLGKNKKANELLYEWFRDDFYNEFTHIHCPSPFIAGQLKEHGYQAKLHIISNGVSVNFIRGVRPKRSRSWRINSSF